MPAEFNGKRFSVSVPPMIWIQNHLVGAQLEQSANLECHSEAYPKSINFWTRDNGEVISQGKILLYIEIENNDICYHLI